MVDLSVTEMFITEVSLEHEPAYKAWLLKVHKAESAFQGFKAVHVQAPTLDSGKRQWVTFLQFDSADNLDRWLQSKERLAMIEESKMFVKEFENRRVASSFSGWFSSVNRDQETPPVWKQTLLVLLVLFPIVMVQFKYLIPLTASLNISLATFLANALSVSLISWPFMPIAIKSLKWWLVPPNSRNKDVCGVVVLACLYVIEVAFFWSFL